MLTYTVTNLILPPHSPLPEFPVEWKAVGITQHGRTYDILVRLGHFIETAPSTNCTVELLDGSDVVGSYTISNQASIVCSGFQSGSGIVIGSWDSSFWGATTGTLLGANTAFAPWSLWP